MVDVRGANVYCVQVPEGRFGYLGALELDGDAWR